MMEKTFSSRACDVFLVLAGSFFLVGMSVTVADVVLRAVANRNVPAAIELTSLSIGLGALLSIPVCYGKRTHVTARLLSEVSPNRFAKPLGLFGGLHPFAAIALAGVLGALVSVPVAVLIFRLRGAYFAIGTWVIAEVFRLGFAQVSALGGGSGSSLPMAIVKSLASKREMRESLSYWLALGAAVLVVTCVYLFLRSRQGLALTAIRDNELAAKSLGIDIWRTKFTVYVVTSALTAMIGALIFLQKLRISPDAAFSVNDWTAFVIFIVVIGGIGTIEGPIIGTLVFFALRETLADLGTIYLIVLGIVAIVVMLKAPKGIWGLIRTRFDLQLFPLGYRVIAPKDDKEA